MVYKGIDDPLKRVCKELLLQRSFFPGYPVSKVPAEYAVDLTKLRELEFSKNLVPDVLLFCSEVKTEPFIEFTNQRAFVSIHNNSMSIKETLIESYTEIYITPLGNKDEDEPVQELDIENRITLLYSTIK
ncbi:uncharacterized protein TA18575 [Theileria annulata]|uniref:Uncharacterized protein n=1 Tax=Theileria annulata TaxID=5874 RepID=Q4UBH3_THEAN|nr:uncharacterized protein TA18575 [Theileria annulata]CAI75828.1 hypothetical protein TA18575 [Theileria annulata]|eukprot:XP_955304.1 hypothetical protein TA18575 [Theileria annulata]